MEWMPIASAPLDKKILGFRKHRGVCLIKWDCEEFTKLKRGFWNSYDIWGKTHDREDAPTHWMPLPEEPK